MHIPGASVYCPGVVSSEWLEVCSGIYTQALEDKYSSFDISKNDSYSIYRLSYAPKVFLIICGTDLFEHCIGVDVYTNKTITCTYKNGSERNLFFFEPFVECMDKTFAFTADLIKSCLHSNERNRMLPRTYPIHANDYTGLIFPGQLNELATNKIRNKGSNIDQNIFLFVFVAVFTLIAIFRRIFL